MTTPPPYPLLNEAISRNSAISYSMRNRIRAATQRHHSHAQTDAPEETALGMMIDLAELALRHSDPTGKSLTMPDPNWAISQIERHLLRNPTL